MGLGEGDLNNSITVECFLYIHMVLQHKLLPFVELFSLSLFP